MKNRIFGYHRDDIHAVLDVVMDGEMLNVETSRKVFNHSTSFGAGYLGSGAAQLALAILLKVTDEKTAIRLHQTFKAEFLANPKYLEEDFVIEVDLKKWVENSLESLSRN